MSSILDAALAGQTDKSGDKTAKKLVKGQAVYSMAAGIRWPAIVMIASRRKHNTDMEAILCEVWGSFHECGSVYRGDLIIATDEEAWRAAVRRQRDGNPDDIYFGGKVVFDAGG